MREITAWLACSAALARMKRPPRRSSSALHLSHQVIHYSFKRVESERLPNRRAKVGIGVDVVEDPLAIGGLQIFDSSDVETSGRHDSFSHLDRRAGHVFVGIELH